jgi:hypothetical protein
MFTKVRPKQEQFLILVVDGMPAQRAYATVYGQDKNANTCAASASKMLNQPKVLARRQELIAAKMAAQPMGVPFLTGELIAVAGEARALGQGSAAVQALMGVAKLHGLLVDRVQADVLVRKPSASPESPDDLSAEEWLNQYASAKLLEQKPLDEVDRSAEPHDGALDDGALHD